MSQANDLPKRPAVPSPQDNLARAEQRAFETLAEQSEEQLLWLGAKRLGDAWQVAVLEEELVVNTSARQIATSAGGDVNPQWSILVLHYLAVQSRPPKRPPETTFADLATARSYASVYQGRVITRLCYTAGRDAETLRTAANALGGRDVEAGDVGFDFDVFPRVSLRLIWHAPDEEFPPSATLLLPSNIESYFCSEDIVVLSESLVARLSGRPF